MKHIYVVCVGDVMIGTTCLERIAEVTESSFIEVANALDDLACQFDHFQESVFNISATMLGSLKSDCSRHWETKPVFANPYKPKISRSKYEANNYKRSGIRAARNMARSRA